MDAQRSPREPVVHGQTAQETLSEADDWFTTNGSSPRQDGLSFPATLQVNINNFEFVINTNDDHEAMIAGTDDGFSTPCRRSSATARRQLPYNRAIAENNVIVSDAMPRSSKRACRHRNQTMDFFEYEPPIKWEASDGKVKSTILPATSDKPTAVPGPHLGRSASPESSEVDLTVEKKHYRINAIDMLHGLILEASGRSKGSSKSESTMALYPWDVLDAFPYTLRRRAARDTIVHLSKVMQAYIIGDDSNPEILPFVNEDELLEMVNKAKASVDLLVNSSQPQGSSSIAAIEPSPCCGSQDEGWEQKLNAEHLQCTTRTRIWGGLLVHANRKLREEWILEMEDDDGVVLPDAEPERTSMYKTVKAEIQVTLQKKMEAARFDGNLDKSIKSAISKTVLSEGNITHSQKYGKLLATPGFFAVAKAHLKEWCDRNSVKARSKRCGTQFLRLLRDAEGLPTNAWACALPPFWNEEQESWTWKDLAHANFCEHCGCAPTDGGHESHDESSRKAGKVAESTLESGDRHNPTTSTFSQQDTQSQATEQPLGLTKNQKRAKARKEKKKAERAAKQKAEEAKDTDDAFVTPEGSAQNAEAPNTAAQPAAGNGKDTDEARPEVSTSSERVMIDGITCRVPAAPRVDLETAIKLAIKGQLRIPMCPALETGDADRLLKACEHFQSGIDRTTLAKDPHVMTRFLMKAGLKPSEYEEVLDFEKFLEAMKRIEALQLTEKTTDDAETTGGATRASGKGENQKGEGKMTEPGSTNTRPTASTSDNGSTALLAEYDSTSPVSYPPPPTILDHDHMIPWAHSLTASQLASLSTQRHRTLALRALVLAARLFLSSAARELTPKMFERLVAPASNVLRAVDLPAARYELGRIIILTQIKREGVARYKAEKGRNRKGRRSRLPVPDYPALAMEYFDRRYEPVSEIVSRCRETAESPANDYLIDTAADLAVEDWEAHGVWKQEAQGKGKRQGQGKKTVGAGAGTDAPTTDKGTAKGKQKVVDNGNSSTSCCCCCCYSNKSDPAATSTLSLPSHLVDQTEQTVDEMRSLAAMQADGLERFLTQWPRLKAVVIGDAATYLPNA